MRIEDPRRNQMDGIALALDHDRVSGVIAPLVTDDQVGFLGEVIGDLAFSLVTPLGAY
jgi:hypothetical protein